MNRKHILCIFLSCMIGLTGCKNKVNDNKDYILLEVNGNPVMNSELQQVKKQYEQMGFSEIELLEGIVLENIVLSEVDNYHLTVTDDEVNDLFGSLKELNEGDIFYEKALKIYGSDDAIKEKYYYSILYDKVKHKINDCFMESYETNKKVLERKTEDYISQFDLLEDEKEEFEEDVFETYAESLQDELSELYFKVWQYKMVSDSIIDSARIDTSELFRKYDYEICETYVNYNNTKYELETWSYDTFQEVFGNVFYLPDDMEQRCEEIRVLHEPSKDLKAFYIHMLTQNDESIIIKAMITPHLSISDNKKGVTMTENKEDSFYRCELRQHDYGIYYLIQSEDNVNFEELVNQFVPYQVLQKGME